MNLQLSRSRSHLSSRVIKIFAVAIALFAVFFPRNARAEKLKDVVDVVGVRDNQLVGYGVITGLNGTGDDISAPFAAQSLLALMRRLGMQMSPDNVRLKNVAAVVVTATMPPFARPGSRLDVTVSSMGNAKSLQGGVLVQTLLVGADSRVYAVAQGALVVGGFEAHGASGSSVMKNSTNTARIAAGALIERQIDTNYVKDGTVVLSLRQADFTTAQRISERVNRELGDGAAAPLDAGAVQVKLPQAMATRPVELLARIGELDVTVAAPARVVINERTGTIVAGGDVRLAPAAIASGGITVVIKESTEVSQPNALAKGNTVAAPKSDVTTKEGTPQMAYLDGAASLADVASALNSLGVSPRELASVLEALRAAGALHATVVIQ